MCKFVVYNIGIKFKCSFSKLFVLHDYGAIHSAMWLGRDIVFNSARVGLLQVKFSMCGTTVTLN